MYLRAPLCHSIVRYLIAFCRPYFGPLNLPAVGIGHAGPGRSSSKCPNTDSLSARHWTETVEGVETVLNNQNPLDS